VRAEAAARLGRVQRRKEKLQRLIAARNDPNKWLGENDSDWEMWVYCTSLIHYRTVSVIEVYSALHAHHSIHSPVTLSNTSLLSVLFVIPPYGSRGHLVYCVFFCLFVCTVMDFSAVKKIAA